MTPPCKRCGLKMFKTDQGVCPVCQPEQHPQRSQVIRLQQPQFEDMSDAEISALPSEVKYDQPITDMEEIRRLHVISVANMFSGCRSKMSEALGVNVITVYKWCDLYGIPGRKEYEHEL